ncbi:MAG: hypothetical protein ACWGQW_24265, partial [bacterium]
KEKNQDDARRWAQYMAHFSASDSLWTDIEAGLGVIDVLSLGAIGVIKSGVKKLFTAGSKAALKAGVRKKTAAEAAEDLVTTARQVTEAASKPNATPADIAYGAGKLKEAGKAKAAVRIARQGENLSPEKMLKEISDELPSFFSPGEFFKSTRLGNEVAGRLEKAFNNLRGLQLGLLERLPMVQRLTEPELAKGLELAFESFKTQYPHLKDTVIQVDNIKPMDARLENVGKVQVVLGKRDATLFETAESATKTALKQYKLHPEDFVPIKQGEKYGIMVERYIDETNPELAKIEIPTEDTTNKGLAALLGWGWRGLDSVTSKQQTIDRKLAQQTRSKFGQARKLALQPIAKLNKKQKTRLNSILEDNRTTMRMDPV